MSLPHEQNLNILLVEDNPGDAQLVRHTLRQVPTLQFKLTHEERLDSAMRRAQEQQFDVILLDLSLPDSHGMETIVRTLKQAPHVAIVVLTGINDEKLGEEAVRHGAEDYLVKGEVDGWALTKAIRYAMERKKVQEDFTRTQRELRELRVKFARLLSLLPACPNCGHSRTEQPPPQQVLEFFDKCSLDERRDGFCPICAAAAKDERDSST